MRAADPVRRLRAPLLRWYRKHKRDLPWRDTHDPFAIWVSEVMLQQTTVAAVLPYWRRFLDRFPDVPSLALAREEDVLAAWTGLGYYRRARSLREGAIAVMERHDGRIPGDVDSLSTLPGIGRYTAGAIASVAFGRQAPIVDGNVKRVFSRLFAIRGSGAKIEQRYWSIAETLVAGATPGDLNQAIMELGALVCAPRTPGCEICPVRAHCKAHALGKPEEYPELPQRKRIVALPTAVAWIEQRGRVLLVRKQPGGLLKGTWDLPAAPIAPGRTPDDALVRHAKQGHGLRLAVSRVIAHVTHTILAKRLEIDVVAFSRATGPQLDSHLWVAPAALNDVATSGATMKIARAVTAQKRSHASRSASTSASVSSGGRGRVNA
jgi:A/G-specific adenine glycosylase